MDQWSKRWTNGAIDVIHVIRHTKCDISKLNATVSRIASEKWGQPTVDKEL